MVCFPLSSRRYLLSQALAWRTDLILTVACKSVSFTGRLSFFLSAGTNKGNSYSSQKQMLDASVTYGLVPEMLCVCNTLSLVLFLFSFASSL